MTASIDDLPEPTDSDDRAIGLEVPAKRLFMGVSLDEAVDPSAVDDPEALRLLADAATAWRATGQPPTSVRTTSRST